MTQTAALHGHLEHSPKERTSCSSQPSWDHSSSNTTWTSEAMEAKKGMRNDLSKLQRIPGTQAGYPVSLLFSSVLPSGRGRCHLPQITICCYFCLSGTHSSAPVFPRTQAQTSPGLNFPTIHYLEKPEQPKLLDVAASGEVHEGRRSRVP